MTTLVEQSTWVLVVAWLLVGGGVAVAARWTLLRFVEPADRMGAAAIAGPLMPALGAAFALLAALSLAGEAAAVRSAENDVSLEAAAASRLAWASTSPGVDSGPMQAALGDYLAATTANEWSTTDQRGDETTLRALAALQAAVRDAAAADGLGSAQAGELLTSVGSLSSLRRERLAVAAHPLPGFYVAVVVVSGLALIVNSAALAVGARRRIALLTTGLVLVVSLAVALLFALSAPFSGGFVVDDRPIAEVASDLQQGLFEP